jgi:DNA-binding response OmpR family regulator
MKTILIIENKTDILENLKEAFEIEGYKVLVSNSGTKGVELAREFIPDLIISGILIGEMDGYEVLSLLLGTRSTSRIPFIFSTTKSEKRDRILAFELGADDYIVKPYELGDMFSMTKQWIKSGKEKVLKHVSTCPSIVNASVFSQNLVGVAVCN